MANILASNTQLTLYYHPFTRSERVLWLLEELGLTYQLKTIALFKGEHKQKAYLAIHPLGKIPALDIDGTILYESTAICMYLTERFSNNVLQPNLTSPLRGIYLQWISFCSATLEPAIIEQMREKKANASKMNVVSMGPMLTPFTDTMTLLESLFTQQDYLLGEKFSTADLITAALLNLADGDSLLAEYPVAKNWLEKIKQRPAFIRAYTKREEGK